MYDILAISTNIGVIGYLIYLLITGGLGSFSTDYVFIGYTIFTLLTLPNLISKVIFRSKIVSLTSIFCFLYYPLLYIIAVVVGRVGGASLSEILPFVSIFNLLSWNILFALFILLDEKRGDYSEKIVKNIILGMIPALILSVLTATLIRQKDSVVALDYLQHTTVPNKMYYGDQICILPSQCSNLFLQHGYTTFYHIILGFLTTFIHNDPIKTFFMLDILLPIVASTPLFYIFKKYTKNNLWSQLGVFISLSVFVTGAYEFIFFIPQTFAFLIFLMALKVEKMDFKKLVALTLLLTSIHFIFGPTLSGLLWFKFIILDKLNKRIEIKVTYLILLLTAIFFLLANIAGFSFEKMLQEDAVNIIGSLTNTYYPNNLTSIWNILGAVWLFIPVIYITNIFERSKSKASIVATSFTVIMLILYLLAPTYANKFTMGIGVYVSILLIIFLSKRNFNIISKITIFTILPIIFFTNFYIRYREYLTFYTQYNGRVSAVTEEDMKIVEYFKSNTNPPRYVISDPYTQIILTSLANIDTPRAQYMLLDLRENLYSYLKNPTPATYEKLISTESFPTGQDIGILLSSRLYRSLLYEDKSWIYNIYSLDINSDEKIVDIDERLIQDMKRAGKQSIYINDNFVLFR